MNLSKIVIAKQVVNNVDNSTHYLSDFIVYVEPNDTLIQHQKYIIELYQDNKINTDDLYVLEYHNDKYFIGLPFKKYVENYNMEYNVYEKMLNDNITMLENIKNSIDTESKDNFIKKMKKQQKQQKKEKKNKKSYNIEDLINKLKLDEQI